MTIVNTYNVAHMAAQARVKDLSTKVAQDKLRDQINLLIESEQELSGNQLMKNIIATLKSNIEHAKVINQILANGDYSTFGIPNKHNKTIEQLQIALSRISEDDEQMMSKLQQGLYYQNLSNELDFDSLPQLGSPNDQSFWGNENSSATSVLLSSIAHTLDPQNLQLDGIATFYPFYDVNYKIPVVENYPFATEHGLYLFGQYQYGGHRYFSDHHINLGQFYFGPEDCSSAVAKTTKLSEEQLLVTNTTTIRDSYYNSNNPYHYNPITSNDDSIDKDLIKAGDLFVKGVHVAIICEKYNINSEIQCIEFNRDIDTQGLKFLGGGTRTYNLETGTATNARIHILRKVGNELGESYELSHLLSRIDDNFDNNIQEGNSLTGDCFDFVTGEF